jgi:excisionase family DNA binding protein
MEEKPKPLASVKDLAELCTVSEATVHQWIYKGTGPKSYKIGKHRRFRWSDVYAWLEERADDPKPAA